MMIDVQSLFVYLNRVNVTFNLGTGPYWSGCKGCTLERMYVHVYLVPPRPARAAARGSRGRRDIRAAIATRRAVCVCVHPIDGGCDAADQDVARGLVNRFER